MEKYLLQLILKHSFYINNKNIIIEEYFPDNLKRLYLLILAIHEKYQKDITVYDLKELYKVQYPATTKAQLDLIFEVLDNLPGEVTEDVAKEVLQKAFILEQGRKIAEIGLNIVNGKEANFEEVRAILNKIEEGSISDRDDLQQVSSNLEDILEAINITTKWYFNIPPLQTVCGGIGPGIFTIAGARVEAGKTAFGISLAAAPNGFAEQTAVTNFYCNEESAQRTQGRAVMAYTGMSLQEILLTPNKVKKQYDKIKDRLKFFNCRGKTIHDIERHVAKNRPDVCIIDQLDKLAINGTFAREDERLGSLYIAARDVGSRYDAAMIALSQLHADAEGKSYVSSANFANARTAKTAEGDIVLGIGKSPIHDDNVRIFNVIKSKITGLHQDVVAILHSQISRYTA